MLLGSHSALSISGNETFKASDLVRGLQIMADLQNGDTLGGGWSGTGGPRGVTIADIESLRREIADLRLVSIERDTARQEADRQLAG